MQVAEGPGRHEHAARLAHAAGDYLGERAAFELAVQEQPTRSELWHALAEVAFDLGDIPTALRAAERGLALTPDDPKLVVLAAQAEDADGRVDAAERRLRALLLRSPHDEPARASLAGLLERSNELAAAEREARLGLRTAPQSPLLNLIVATCRLRGGDLDSCADYLDRVQPRPGVDRVLQSAAFLRGHLLDARGDAAAAFAAFVAANARAAVESRKRGVDGGAYRTLVAAETAAYASAWPDRWRALPAPAPLPFQPAFLVGFPRSGTTLIEQILDAHPAVAAIEEQPFVEELVAGVAASGGYPNALADLTAARREELRHGYLARVQARGTHAARVVVDKMPLNLVRAGLIHRIFPEARFVLALRHPYDVVLSCFMQAFAENSATVRFHDLTDAAALYDEVFTAWSTIRARLPLAVCELRYEALVADLQAEVTPVLAHLGLGWDPGVSGFAASASVRGNIRTPSYSQVTRGLYTGARARFTRYLPYFSPEARAMLDPWVARWGYPPVSVTP